MPSNCSMSPPKRRAHRSASSSSLVVPVVTTAHVRRLSRVPSTNISPSLSNSHLPRFPSQSSLFPITPDCEPDALPPQPLRAPSLSDHPLSIPRLGAAVDSLIRPPAKGKPPRPHDPPALLILFAMFLVLFVLLIFVLRSVFPSTVQNARISNSRHVHDNLDRIARNITPVQFWPLPDSYERAQQPLPSPYMANVSIPRIWDTRFLATRHLSAKRQRLRLSVVAACKDRTAFLQTALPAWLKQLHPRLDEVVLVDWATSTRDFVPLSEVVRASRDARVSVVTLAHRSPWVLSRAYNLGFSLARGEWILKLDCDTSLHGDFLKHHPLPSAADRFFYRFDWARARDRNEEHLNGLFLVRTAHLRGIHGYDERITTYGWEDSDLYKRMELGTISLHDGTNPGGSDIVSRPRPPNSGMNLISTAVRADEINRSRYLHYDAQTTGLNNKVDIDGSGLVSGNDDNDVDIQSGQVNSLVPPLKAMPIVHDTVRHMPHDDSLRGAAQHLSMGPVLETQVNSQAAEGLPSWSLVGARERTQFQLDILTRDAQFLSAAVLRTPAALLELVTSTRRDAIVAEAVSRVLHDGYGMPWAMLGELDHSHEHVVRVLARSARGRGADAVIFAVLEGTVPDRIVALASALIFAAGHGRPLFLTWERGTREEGDSEKEGAKRTGINKVGDFFDLDDVNSHQGHAATDDETNNSGIEGGVRNEGLGLGINRTEGGGLHNRYSNSASVAAAHSGSRPVFYIRQWKCGAGDQGCVSNDPAFKSLLEWHNGRVISSSSALPSSQDVPLSDMQLEEQKQQQKRLDDVVQGRVSGKRNVLLRLRGALPDHSENQIEFAAAALRPSEGVRAYVRAVSDGSGSGNDLGNHLGVYIGTAVHGSKQVEAMVTRIKKLREGNDAASMYYFVTGSQSQRTLIELARGMLQMSPATAELVRKAEDRLKKEPEAGMREEEDGETRREVTREVAELMLLARCKQVMNDGRASQNAMAVIKAFQQQFRHEQQLDRQRQS